MLSVRCRYPLAWRTVPSGKRSQGYNIMYGSQDFGTSLFNVQRITIALRKYGFDTEALKANNNHPSTKLPWMIDMESMHDGLKGTCDLLHILHHRNKNQHRQGHWWKWLSMLYRCTKKLRDESEANEVEPVCARIRYMKEMLLPKCYV